METPIKSANICAGKKKFYFGMEGKNPPLYSSSPQVGERALAHAPPYEENKKEERTRRRLSRKKWESPIASWDSHGEHTSARHWSHRRYWLVTHFE